MLQREANDTHSFEEATKFRYKCLLTQSCICIHITFIHSTILIESLNWVKLKITYQEQTYRRTQNAHTPIFTSTYLYIQRAFERIPLQEKPLICTWPALEIAARQTWTRFRVSSPLASCGKTHVASGRMKTDESHPTSPGSLQTMASHVALHSNTLQHMS